MELSNFHQNILKLKLIESIGNKTIRKIVDNLESIQTKFIRSEIKSFLELKQLDEFNSIKDFELETKLEKLIEYLEKKNINSVSIYDEDYPIGLRNISDAPVQFFYLGNLDYDYQKSIAIVGTRRFSE